ncbi:hypothetical protein RQP46_005298 [Phenoliferia psychrophenolica]
MSKYGFDGVDLGIGCNGSSPADSANLLAFLAILRLSLGPTKLITAAYLNFVNIMSYDFSGHWSPQTGPNSPLHSGIPAYGISFTTLSATLELTTSGEMETILYQPIASGTPKGDIYDVSSTAADVCGAPGTGYDGIWQYKTLLSGGILSSDGSRGLGGYTRHFDVCTQTPVLFNPTTREFISYEDTQSAKAKAAYASKMGLGGV